MSETPPEKANIGLTRTHKYRSLTDAEITERLGVEYTSPEFQRAHRAVTDGGTTDPEDARRFTPEPGARCRDREADLGEGELLVLTVPDAHADELLVKGTEQTVAEYNTGYQPDTPVVRAVYTDDLDACTEWRALQELRGGVDEGELRAYDFPAVRLGPLPGGSRRDGEGGL
jgi:hypothetical protein